MKSGYVLNKYVNEIQALHDFVWIEMLDGDEYILGYEDTWKNTDSFKRGIVHKVYLDNDSNTVNNNASKMHELIGTLRLSSVNNDVPIIVDIWSFAKGAQFQFDHIKQYLNYLPQYVTLTKKPLIRVLPSTWEAWYTKNAYEAEKLLNVCDILLAEWGVKQPRILTKIGRPKWWEYADGKIKYDETGLWTIEEEEIPAPPPVVVPPPVVEPTPPPVVTPPPPPTTEPTPEIKIPKKWKISLFGGLISGTVEAIEE